MKRGVLLSVCLIAWLPVAQAGDLYRWVDSSGKVHYGDAPPPDAAQIETRKFPDTPADGSLPYETRRAQQNFPVTLYVSDNCGDFCDKARSLLRKRGIPFTEKNLATRADVDAFRQMSGSDTVPSLSVGKTVLKGFLAEQWSSELDIAGYPKSAPYRPLPAPAQSPADSPATTNQPVEAP
jgi:glutaredoxin